MKRKDIAATTDCAECDLRIQVIRNTSRLHLVERDICQQVLETSRETSLTREHVVEHGRELARFGKELTAIKVAVNSLLAILRGKQ